MYIKTIIYADVYEELIQIYRRDPRIKKMETIEEWLNFLIENKKDRLQVEVV